MDNRLNNIHPGEVLQEEFLTPFGMTAYRLAKSIDVPQTRIGDIISGKRSITADTALRLSKFFGTTPDFWLNLQAAYDLEDEKGKLQEKLTAIQPYRVVVAAG